MAISVGDRIPSVTVKHLSDAGLEDLSTDAVFGGKTVALFAVPGAYTPTCTAKHLPGFVANAGQLKDKGVDTIVCMSVNDPFVMKAWADSQDASAIDMFPDWNAELTKAMGLDADLSVAGLGVRSQRFAMVVKDGVVSYLAVEDSPGDLDKSSAENVLANV